MAGNILPYRSDPAELRRYLVALARGRSSRELKEREFSPKSYEGVVTSAECLRLTEGKEGACTELGRRLALAQGAELSNVAGEVLRSYAPYAEVLSAEKEGGAAETTLSTVERFWAERGMGSSESNRNEAAPNFARFVETAGLGKYVQGRKGKVSRIVWTGNGSERPSTGGTQRTVRDSPAVRPVERGSDTRPEREPPVPPAVAPDVLRERASSGTFDGDGAETPGAGSTRQVLEWELAAGRWIRLELPPSLTAREMERVRGVIALLLDAG